MAGEDEEKFKIKQYTLTFPALTSLMPTENIASVDLPKDANFLLSTVAGLDLLLYYLVETSVEEESVRFIALRVGEETKRDVSTLVYNGALMQFLEYRFVFQIDEAD